ncbi:N-acetylmuramoyl-L-alanine amidase [Smaragdicoccus niigatensis]|uniref:N-acetylmuramoyl-L-alanine amidase n=1 Tax=Smaragdicoccus niigatensis TaxID=359359 RepID=UPI00037A69FE|nr:N-acetylmuramoyl-L-alanine amidase [Smaragdicoccus niigatensis]
MPNRRRKHSLVVGVVAFATVASPLGVIGLNYGPDIKNADNAHPTDLASVLLKTVPDVVIPIKQLTGLDLPDFRLSDLTSLPLPGGIKLPVSLPGAPGESPITDPSAPVNPGTLPSDVADKYGTQVKEIHRDQPFSMVALAAKDMAGGTVAQVRPKLANGSWGPWTEAEALGWRDNKPGALTGTDPIYVGKTNDVQVMLTSGLKEAAAAGQALEQVPQAAATGIKPAAFSTPLHAADPAAAPTDATAATTDANASTSPDPNAATTTTADDLTAVLIDPGQTTDDANLKFEKLPNGGPEVVTRAAWGADESMRCEDPTYDDAVSAGTVHHTAGRNDYTPEESAGIVRAIYKYHAQTLGWCDIGYQALVDRFGRTFEGRYGGMTRNVEGAHAGGFNENTVGVAMMGTFDTEQPTAEQLKATGTYLGWRLKMAGVDPKGHATHYSEGTSYTKYPQGEAVDLPNIFAHRDVGTTDCPGDAAYADLDQIRTIAASVQGVTPQSLPLPDIAQLLAGTGNTTPATPTTPQAPAADAAAVPAAPDLPAEIKASAPADAAAASGATTTSATGSLSTLLTGLTTAVLQPTDDNAVAKRWVAEGGATGKLGPALTGLITTSSGQSVAKFANGIIFTAAKPTTVGTADTASTQPQTIVLLGEVLKKFMASGNVTGQLGMPLADSATADTQTFKFQRGSLILNKLTGVVTTQ